MSSHNWKFDYKNNPWDNVVNKTDGNLDNFKKGHYRICNDLQHLANTSNIILTDAVNENPLVPVKTDNLLGQAIKKYKTSQKVKADRYRVDEKIVDINTIDTFQRNSRRNS